MSKYKAEKIVADGYKFDSKVESKYYEKLKDDKAKGLILNFELQPRFELMPKFEFEGKKYRKTEYVADFLVYRIDGSIYAVDIKGLATETALLKRKMHMYYSKVPLRWIVWNKGQWRGYDEVIKERANNKKVKKLENKS